MSAEGRCVYLLFDYAWATEGLPTLIGVFSTAASARQAARGVPHLRIRRAALDSLKSDDDEEIGEYVDLDE